jgi:hypothetical protein
MPRWLLVGLLGGAIVTACVLPDVEIDPGLGGVPENGVGSNQPGVGGAGISVPPLGGSSGAAGQTGDIDPDTITPPGAGGSASTGVNAGGALGGSGGAAGTGGAGAAGSAGTGGTGTGGTGGSSTGAGGTASVVPNPMDVIMECTPALDRETACINYCQQYIEACGDFEEANTYGGVADCTATCIGSLWPVGDTTTGSGSICCRWLHATLAAQNLTSQNPHCFHAAEVPSLGQSGGCAPGAGQ